MAPAQGWHAQIEKCRMFFLLFFILLSLSLFSSLLFSSSLLLFFSSLLQSLSSYQQIEGITGGGREIEREQDCDWKDWTNLCAFTVNILYKDTEKTTLSSSRQLKYQVLLLIFFCTLRIRGRKGVKHEQAVTVHLHDAVTTTFALLCFVWKSLLFGSFFFFFFVLLNG